MNKIIRPLRFIVWCLVPALLLAPMLTGMLPAPAQAGRMIWTAVDTPGNLFGVVLSPSEIDFMQVCSDGRTVYAVDTANSKAYRSDDSGASWLDLTGHLAAAGAALPAWYVAAAPDNPRFVAVVTTAAAGVPGRVFVSVDSGQTWDDTGLALAGPIGALAISPNYGSYEIAVGTRSGGMGGVTIYKGTGLGGSWADQPGLTGDVLALKYSPNCRADPSLAVMYSTGAGTFFNVGVRDVNANATNWTAIYNGNPPEITIGGAGSSAKAGQVISGDMELPADYSGQAPSMCRAYASVDSAGGVAGVFRIDGNTVYQLMAAQPNKRVSSIAYRGTYISGRLLVGEVLGNSAQAAVMTWFTDAPNTCPATCWFQAEKSPTGAGGSGFGNAQVAWAPDGRAFCGTSSAPLTGPAAWPGAYLNGAALDESALSVSRDNGRTWNQLSLIDTQISALSDVVASMDSSIVYLATINSSGPKLHSIWRSGGQPTGKSWERVLCLSSTSNDIILRMNNVENAPAIFFASRRTDDLRQSQDNGQTWEAQLPGMGVNDFSVTSIGEARYLFALGNTLVRKANVTALVAQWSPQVATNLSGGHTIFAAPTGAVVVGGDNSDNRVALSADGGMSFADTEPLPVGGRVHAIADFRLRNGFLVYAATDQEGGDIYALIPGELPWNPMSAPDTAFWGLAQMSTLYGASQGSGVDRTLQPEALGPPSIEWSVLDQGLPPGVVFTREPTSLKLSAGATLWAIDNRPYDSTAGVGKLWTYCDCLSPVGPYVPPPPPPKEVLFTAPVPLAPRTDDLIPVFITTNEVGDVVFQWRHNTAARSYELWLAVDAGFSQVLLKQTILPQNRTAPSWTLADKSVLRPGGTYYWKVRVVQAVTGDKDTGEWSPALRFAVARNESAPTGPAQPSAPAAQAPGDVSQKPGGSPVRVSPAASGTDNVTSFISSLLSDNSKWIWLVVGVLGLVLLIVIITGVVSSRRKL